MPPLESPLKTLIDKVISTGETIYLSNHTTLLSKGGSEYQIADSAAPIRNGDDNILGMVLIFNDVSEQYQMRESIRASELEQKEILNSMVNAVITIDETGKILTLNRASEILFGYPLDEAVKMNINEFMPEPFASQHDHYLQRYLLTDEPHIINLPVGREVEGLRKNKDVFPMRLLVAELAKSNDGKRRFIGSCIDLSQIKQQEEQLRRTQKMDALGKLTGGIAHDYNNILGVILGYAELIQEESRENEKLASYIEEIIHAGERGAQLSGKLLSFTRKKSSNEKQLNINTVLKDSQLMLEKTLTVRISLSYDLADDLENVNLDESELEDAILNICINSMHAIDGNGKLTIQTRNEIINETDSKLFHINSGDYILLSITDTGCGMDATIIEKMFDPFYSTKGKRGTGLGLSQVYGFVQRSGGTIKVYSEPGHGTRLALYFPIYHDNEEVNQKSDNNLESNLSGTETILIVDDEPALSKLISEILTLKGYKILCADSAAQALDLLAETPVDLLVSDVVMPEMDGYQLAEIVQEKYPTVKVQMVSGFSDNRHKDMTDEGLHKKLLNKPYQSQTLLKRIRELLD